MAIQIQNERERKREDKGRDEINISFSGVIVVVVIISFAVVVVVFDVAVDVSPVLQNRQKDNQLCFGLRILYCAWSLEGTNII